VHLLLKVKVPFPLCTSLLLRVVLVDPAGIMFERAVRHRIDDFVDGMQAGQERNQVGLTEVVHSTLAHPAGNDGHTIHDRRNHGLMASLVRFAVMVSIVVGSFLGREAVMTGFLTPFLLDGLSVSKGDDLVELRTAKVRTHCRSIVRDNCYYSILEIHNRSPLDC
jgi:hypothetical protein